MDPKKEQVKRPTREKSLFRQKVEVLFVLHGKTKKYLAVFFARRS